MLQHLFLDHDAEILGTPDKVVDAFARVCEDADQVDIALPEGSRRQGGALLRAGGVDVHLIGRGSGAGRAAGSPPQHPVVPHEHRRRVRAAADGRG